MEIIGRGFIASHLAGISDRHPAALVLAAGVSSTTTTSALEFDREARLVEATVDRCRTTGRLLVFFSTASASMYGAPGCTGREDEPVTPQSPYGRHKLALEELLAASCVDYLVFRLGHVVGPDQPAHQLLPALVSQVRSGTVKVYQGARRDLIDIADVVTVLDALLANGVCREVVNVASGCAVPVVEIIDHIERRIGLSARREIVAAPLPHSAAVVSTTKLRRLVPQVARACLAPDYYRTVLDRYIGAVAAVA